MPLYSFKNVISLFTSTTSAANSLVAETDLITYPMPASTLAANGQKVRITVRGIAAANANSKSVRVYFGATMIGGLVGSTTLNGAFGITATVWRTGAATQLGFLEFGGVGAASVSIGSNTTPAETLSGAVTIKVTGQSAVTSGDVTALAMAIELIP